MGLFNKEVVNPEAPNTPATPEKTTAEIIAESVAAAMKPLVDSNAALSLRLDTIAAQTKRPEPVATPLERPSVFDDEEAAFATRIGPVLQRQLETEARLAYNDVKAEYVGLGYEEAIKKFEPQIKQVLENSPLVGGDNKLVRGDSNYIRNVVNMVFGQEAMKKGLKFGGREQGFFVESAGADGTHSAGGPVEDGLTDGQRKVFNRMGVKSDDAKKTMGKLKFIN